MNIFDLKEIITFCKVVELKSFSEAANYLCITQPSVSQHISKLEKNLGVTLLNREGKNLELTYEGKIFYKSAKKILKEVMNATSKIEEIKGLKRGTITIGASTLPGEYILPEIIGDFSRNYPEVEINLHIKDTFSIIEEIIHSNFDIGIVGSKYEENSIEFEKIFEDLIILVAKEDFKFDEVDIHELKNFNFVLREMSSGTLFTVNEALKKFKLKIYELPKKIVVDSLNSQKELIKYGAGIGFISEIAVRNEIKNGILKEIKVKDLTPIKRDFFTIRKKKSTLSKIAEKFYEKLLNFRKSYYNSHT